MRSRTCYSELSGKGRGGPDRGSGNRQNHIMPLFPAASARQCGNGLYSAPQTDRTGITQRTICSEFGIIVPLSANTKVLVDAIHNFCSTSMRKGIHLRSSSTKHRTCQRMSFEELRLLTNLETDQRNSCRSSCSGNRSYVICWRMIIYASSRSGDGEYHLGALQPIDVRGYLAYRLSVAGCSPELFNESAIKRIAKLSQGIPRLINLIADRGLLVAYSENEHQVTVATVNSATKEVGFLAFRRSKSRLIPGRSR